METGDSWRQLGGKSLYGLKKVEKYSLCPLGTLQCIVQTRNQCRKCDIRSPSQQKEEWLEGLEEPAATILNGDGWWTPVQRWGLQIIL